MQIEPDTVYNMNDLNKTLSEVFDIDPIKDPGILDTNTKKNPTLPTRYNDPDLKQDLTDAYQQSKENLQEIIEIGRAHV